jgi:hypothetical protein
MHLLGIVSSITFLGKREATHMLQGPALLEVLILIAKVIDVQAKITSPNQASRAAFDEVMTGDTSQ